MTPTAHEIQNGVLYLGLGIDEEMFASPYYWHLPAIAYLDYDHEQRLFLKNLKYETHDLTFWEDDGKTTRLATIRHLEDLRHRCQVLGLDCAFNATDLLLIYFCDQNSDACMRLFTLRIADLLDEHIPGSQATSLYIRAVHHLIEPFRVPQFGTPIDVQRSVSCGITILRLWRRVLELKKMALHSKPGAKNDPTKRGKFITYGCYKTAEILFAAATVHQLAMFLHFKELGPDCASPYNSDTKATERIIGEMQGKTTELQSLDSQPTFGDMLDRSSKVQFNLNVKQRLSFAGAQVTTSHKRKKLAFALKERQHTKQYCYPDNYVNFKEAQIEAHRDGVKEGQALFRKYLPSECVDLLQKTQHWDKPYTFAKPPGYTVVNCQPSEGYNKLNLSFTDVSNVDTCETREDISCEVEGEEEGGKEGEEDTASPSTSTLGKSAREQVANNSQDVTDFKVCQASEGRGCEDDDAVLLRIYTPPRSDVCGQDEDKDHKDENVVDDCRDKGGRAWKISKCVNGRLTYMHVKQAIKILLPREYISRSRQKRHWASKYLPGKEPLNPNHDIFKYCDVALKVVQKGKKKFQIGRVEAIQLTKDGSEITSFQTKSKLPVRIRCSLYNHEGDGVYGVRDDVILTNWKTNSSIIGKIVLKPIPGQRFKYTLHPSSEDYLDKLGNVPAYCCEKGSSPSLIEDDNHSDNSSSELDDEFFEVEDVLDRRLSKDTLCYEYKVRFKGYGSEEDMWLPSSFFNRAVQFQSTSKFGRKRKHNLDLENAVEVKKKKSFNKSEPKERNSKLKSSCQVENKAKFRNERKKEQQSSSSAKKSRKPSPHEIKEALEERSNSLDAKPSP